LKEKRFSNQFLFNTSILYSSHFRIIQFRPLSQVKRIWKWSPDNKFNKSHQFRMHFLLH